MKPERQTKQRNNKNFLLANKIPLGVHSFHETLLACGIVRSFHWDLSMARNTQTSQRESSALMSLTSSQKLCLWPPCMTNQISTVFDTNHFILLSFIIVCRQRKNRWNLRLRTPLRNLSSEFFTPTIGGDSSGLLESFCGWQFWFTKALGWRERIFLFGDYFSTNLNVEIFSVKGWQYSLITICSKIFLIRLLIIDVHCSTSCRKIPPAYTRVKLCKYLLLLLSRITS